MKHFDVSQCLHSQANPTVGHHISLSYRWNRCYNIPDSPTWMDGPASNIKAFEILLGTWLELINWILCKQYVWPFHPYLTFAVLQKIVPCFVWTRELCGPPTDIPPSGLSNIFFFQHVKHPSCIINSVPLVINYEPWANLVLVAR